MHDNHFADALADAFLLFCISMANWAALEQGLRILSLVIACLVGGYRLVAIIRRLVRKRRTALSQSHQDPQDPTQPNANS